MGIGHAFPTPTWTPSPEVSYTPSHRSYDMDIGMLTDFPDSTRLSKFEVNDKSNDKTDDRYVKLVNKLKELLPPECGDKFTALAEVMHYVGALLYGDDLHRFATYNSFTNKKCVFEALEELVMNAQEHSLEQFKEQLEAIKEEITTYSEKKDKLVEKNAKLTDTKKKLQSQVNNLKKDNQMLSEQLDAARESIDNYMAKIESIRDDCQVTWEKVKLGDPIYAVTKSTIDSFINNLESAYMTKLGVSSKECKSDFMLNSSGLYEVRSLLKAMDDYTKTISYCVTNYDWMGTDRNRAIALKNLLNNVKLPKISKQASTLSIDKLEKDDDLVGLLRELYYQRMAMEAQAKQKIAEAQLNTLIMSLQKIASEGYDPAQLMELVSSYQDDELTEAEVKVTKKRVNTNK